MEGTLLFISMLAFVATMSFVSGIYFYIGYRKEHLRLLERVKKQTEETTWSQDKLDVLGTIKKDLLRMVGSLGDRIKPKDEGELSHLRKTFLRAGYRGENLTVIFFGVKALLAIFLAAGFFVSRFFILKTLAPLHIMLFSVLFALIGFYLPSLWLRARIARRKEEILKGFPDALDLMVVCVEAGVGLDAAINRVGEELRLRSKVLADEFRILSLELRAGKSRQDALRNLALRADLEDVSSWATLLIQTDKFGTSVAQALRVHSDSMRTKRRQRAEELAGKMAVKLLFPLILFIFPALFVVILGPAAIRLLRVMIPLLNQ
jgi:tight adherence protein C